MRTLPTGYQDVSVLMELSIETWCLVLDAAGETTRLPGQALTHADLWASINAEAPGKELTDALEVIHELGTDGGRDILASAADDQQMELGATNDVPAREMAARLWIKSRTDAKTAGVLLRARVPSLNAAHPRSFREFAGKNARRVSIETERLKAAISQRSARMNYGWATLKGHSRPSQA